MSHNGNLNILSEIIFVLWPILPTPNTAHYFYAKLSDEYKDSEIPVLDVPLPVAKKPATKQTKTKKPAAAESHNQDTATDSKEPSATTLYL